MVFAGYYKNPEATAQSDCHADGWLHTGDVVRVQMVGNRSRSWTASRTS